MSGLEQLSAVDLTAVVVLIGMCAFWARSVWP